MSVSKSTSRTSVQSALRQERLGYYALESWNAPDFEQAGRHWPKSAHRWSSFLALADAAGFQSAELDALKRSPAAPSVGADVILATARFAAETPQGMPVFLALFERGVALTHSYATQHALMVFGAYRPAWLNVDDFFQSMGRESRATQSVMGSRLLQGLWGGAKIKGKSAHQQENGGVDAAPGAETQRLMQWTLALLNGGARGVAEKTTPPGGIVNASVADGLCSFELLHTMARGGHFEALLASLDWASKARADTLTLHGVENSRALIKSVFRPNDILLASCAKASVDPQQAPLAMTIGRRLLNLSVTAHAALQTIATGDISVPALLFLEQLGLDLSQQHVRLASLSGTSSWVASDLPNMLGAVQLLLDRGVHPDMVAASKGPRKPGTPKLKSAATHARDAQRNGTATSVHHAILNEIEFRKARAQREEIALSLAQPSGSSPLPAASAPTVDTPAPSGDEAVAPPASSAPVKKKGMRI